MGGDDTLPEIAAFIFFIFIFVVVPSFLFYLWVTEKPPVCVTYSKVVTVGGCDRSGLCGVIAESGASAVARYPTIGQNVCVKWEEGK
jgi:hypothetical protein